MTRYCNATDRIDRLSISLLAISVISFTIVSIVPHIITVVKNKSVLTVEANIGVFQQCISLNSVVSNNTSKDCAIMKSSCKFDLNINGYDLHYSLCKKECNRFVAIQVSLLIGISLATISLLGFIVSYYKHSLTWRTGGLVISGVSLALATIVLVIIIIEYEYIKEKRNLKIYFDSVFYVHIIGIVLHAIGFTILLMRNPYFAKHDRVDGREERESLIINAPTL